MWVVYCYLRVLFLFHCVHLGQRQRRRVVLCYFFISEISAVLGTLVSISFCFKKKKLIVCSLPWLTVLLKIKAQVEIVKLDLANWYWFLNNWILMIWKWSGTIKVPFCFCGFFFLLKYWLQSHLNTSDEELSLFGYLGWCTWRWFAVNWSELMTVDKTLLLAISNLMPRWLIQAFGMWWTDWNSEILLALLLCLGSSSVKEDEAVNFSHMCFGVMCFLTQRGT